MRIFALLLFTPLAFAQPPAALYSDAARITVCTSPGIGRARLTWSLPARTETQIRVDSPTGPPLTGWNTEASGSASTGDWVTDGMRFYLVNRAGDALAATLLTVRCGGTRPSWFPLDIGNEWTYFYRSRQVTGQYATMRVASTQIIADQLWFLIEGGPFHRSLIREDEQGRIWRFNDLSMLSNQPLLDPTTHDNPDAYYPTRPGPVSYSFSGPIETLVFPFVQVAALDGRSGSFGRNTGLLDLTMTVLAGSSGGFGSGYTLVRARINGKVVFDSPELSLTLGIESQQLTLRPGLVPNCAVPCYFVACGLVPGADPPDTFKPCTRARLAFNAPLPTGATAQLRLTNSNGETVFQTTPSETSLGESSLFQQLPLYSAPNQPLPPGAYLLTGTVHTAQGPLTSSIPLQILP